MAELNPENTGRRETAPWPEIFRELGEVADLLPGTADDAGLGWCAMPSIRPEDAQLTDVQEALAHVKLRAQAAAHDEHSTELERLHLGGSAPEMEFEDRSEGLSAPDSSLAQGAGRRVRQLVNEAPHVLMRAVADASHFDSNTLVGAVTVAAVAAISQFGLLRTAVMGVEVAACGVCYLVAREWFAQRSGDFGSRSEPPLRPNLSRERLF